MKPRVTLVDYGSGNLYSVTRALEHAGADVHLSNDAAEIEGADRLLLPGVGAFADGMDELRARGLIEPIQRYAASGRPLLGICLGMQMLASCSEEFGKHKGLGVIPGRVVPVPATDVDGSPQKIPHIGWAELLPWREGAWAGSPLDRITPGTAAYLVHSFHFLPEDERDGLAVCDYGGHRITAAVCHGAVIGFQFHPEKSGPVGLKLLSAYLGL